MLGSLFAGFCLRLFMWGDSVGIDKWPTKMGFPHYDDTNWNLWSLFFVEVLGTFTLFTVVLTTAINTSRPKTDVYGICIGGTVGMFILAIGPMTGGSLNPQRIIGGAVWSGALWTHKYRHAWIYYFGNYLGGALAGICWYFFFVDWNHTEFPIEKKGRDVYKEVQEDPGKKEERPMFPLWHGKDRKKILIDVDEELMISQVHEKVNAFTKSGKLDLGVGLASLTMKASVDGKKLNVYKHTTEEIHNKMAMHMISLAQNSK